MFCALGGKYGKSRIKYYTKELSKLAENAYNITVVIDYFCKNQPEIEELYNLAPVIENLRMNADKLNAFFIDNEEKVEN